MAYVVVNFKGKELGRWPIGTTLTIGRAGECDVIVRDTLLSRKHCEIAPNGRGWVAIDLGSKNGTRRGKHRISRQPLSDGDVLTMGKTTVRFQVGKLPNEYVTPPKRPADPFEALSGTVSDFDPVAAEVFCRENGLPKPQPIPREPDAYAKDDLYGLLTEIASSSWDSIYAQASQPKRPAARLDGRLRMAGGGGGAAVLAMPRQQSRLGFAEELQVKEIRTTRPARPSNPLELLAAASRPGYRPVAAPASGGGNNSLRRLLLAVVSPLKALHRWVAPAGTIRMF